MGAVALRGSSARRAHGGVRCFGGRGIRPGHGAATSKPLRRNLLGLARRGLPAARRDAGSVAAHLPRGRHAGTVFPPQRGAVGGCAARCQGGCRDERADRGARRRDVAGRVSVDGRVGVWRAQSVVALPQPGIASDSPPLRCGVAELGRSVFEYLSLRCDKLGNVKVKEVIELIETDGWQMVRTKGSHRQFHHPVKNGTVTVSGKMSLDIPPGTLNSILKQAGLK